MSIETILLVGFPLAIAWMLWTRQRRSATERRTDEKYKNLPKTPAEVEAFLKDPDNWEGQL